MGIKVCDQKNVSAKNTPQKADDVIYVRKCHYKNVKKHE